MVGLHVLDWKCYYGVPLSMKEVVENSEIDNVEE